MSKPQQQLALKAAFTAAATLSETGCIAVGYSSRGGWFVWPGGLGLVLMLLLLYLLFGRSR